MENKKKFIIAIIIFIFLGLTIFTFANPSEDGENKAEGNGNDVEDVTKENKDDNEKENDNIVENNDDNNNTNNNETQQVVNNNVLQNTNSDDSYDVALKAVINAEDKIEDDSYNAALDLVNKVTNEEQKNELSSRLEEVKNSIDAKALVATLESKTNSAANKTDMNDARDYRTDEDIENLVANLTNEELKSELQSILNTLSKLLDDTTNPVVNIEDGAILSSTTTITVEDDNEITINLTKNDENSEEIENGTEVSDGVYTLVVTDEAFNTETVTFTIDTTDPVFVGYPESGFTEEDFVISIDDLTDVTITISKRNASEDEDYPKTVENGYVITEEGSYILEATDAAGNTTRVNLGVDKNAPVVTGVEDGEYYNSSVTPVVTDLQLAGAIRLNGEKYTSGTEITEEGTYTLVATDRVGHTTTVTFTIDTTAPAITKVPNGKVVNYSVSPKIEDTNLDTVTLIKNGVEVKNYQDNMYELSHEGTYEITACDKAGNCTTVSFEIDRTAPEMEKLQVYNKNNTSSEYVKNGDTVRVLVTFDEKLGTLPVLTIGNNTATFKETSDGKGGVIYSADITIPEAEEELAEGTLAYTISGYKDLAGNEGIQITETSAQMTLTYDRTAPEMEKLQVYNKNNTSSEYVKNGDTVRVLVTFDEKLGTLPVLTIGNNTATFKETSDGKGGVIYSADITIPEDEEELAEGTLTYTISGYKDLAGNEGVQITESSAQMTLTYDRTNPGYNYVGIMNIDQVTEGYAKVGDRVWVYVVVDEHLSVEPTITINGVEAKIVQTEDGANFNADWYKYVGQVVMTEEMAEGEIEFTINGYKDLAGNEGSTLTNANINKGLEAIILDKTAPTLPTKEDTIGTDPYYSKVSFKPQDNMAIDYYVINGTKVDLTNNWIGDINYQNIKSKLVEGENTIVLYDVAGNKVEKTFYIDWTNPGYNYVGIMNIDQVTEGYAKVGDRVWVYVVVDEHLSVEPTITINGVEAKIVQTEDGANFNADWYKYVGQVVMTEEMAEGEIEFTINGYKDLAGNEGSTLTNANINKGVEAIILDKTAPRLVVKNTSVGTDPVYSRLDMQARDTNLAYITINGTKYSARVDINDGSIQSYVEGQNTVTAVDKAGNVTTKTFTIDRSIGVTTFEELKKAFETGGKIKLLNDIVIEEVLVQKAGINIVLDMNGKTLTLKDETVDPMIDMKTGSSLTITGNGTIDLEDNYYASFILPRGDVTIENGNFLRDAGGTGYGSFFVGINGGKGKLIIKDGYFDGGYYKEGDEFNNSRNLLNGSWGQYIRVYGGTFVGQNPAYGDEGMAYVNPNSTSNYCQAIFFEGQSRLDTEIPEAYTVTKGQLNDGRPTYTVTYTK